MLKGLVVVNFKCINFVNLVFGNVCLMFVVVEIFEEILFLNGL